MVEVSWEPPILQVGFSVNVLGVSSRRSRNMRFKIRVVEDLRHSLGWKALADTGFRA